MSDEKKDVVKKRVLKKGFKRVTVNLQEAEYAELLKWAEAQMREPNNLLSYLLKDELAGLLKKLG